MSRESMYLHRIRGDAVQGEQAGDCDALVAGGRDVDAAARTHDPTKPATEVGTARCRWHVSVGQIVSSVARATQGSPRREIRQL